REAVSEHAVVRGGVPPVDREQPVGAEHVRVDEHRLGAGGTAAEEERRLVLAGLAPHGEVALATRHRRRHEPAREQLGEAGAQPPPPPPPRPPGGGARRSLRTPGPRPPGSPRPPRAGT